MGTVESVGFVLLVVLVVIGASLYAERRRNRAMTAFAQANGYVMDEDVAAFRASLPRLRLFNRGDWGCLANLMRAPREDVTVAVCDYEYSLGSGRTRRVQRQTVCVLRSTKRRLPPFFARRQVALVDLVGKAFGGQDIDFDEDPAFSKAYVLQTVGVEDDVRRLFQQPLRSQLVALAPTNAHVEGRDDTLVYHQGRHLKIEQIHGLVEDAFAVWRSLG